MTLGRVISIIIAVACIGWMLIAAYLCWLGWPYIPLDVSAVDPATISAHRSAVMAHVLKYAFSGLWPTAIVLIVRWLMARRSKS